MPDRAGGRGRTKRTLHSRERIEAAFRFAFEAHLGQTRKDRRTPYIVHPAAVMRVLSSEVGVTDPDLLCAALLHDVLEDTPTTAVQLRAHFGARVARWVEELTIPPEFHGPAVSDAVKTEVQLRAARRISWPAVLVKLADRVDNLRDSANALWTAQKRRAYRNQTREILRIIDRRIKSDPPRPALQGPLGCARRLVRVQLEPH
jgi:GTP diphosphokinase / guanosine-3',5'-bis(diphosphate) 3'-diphosphatase